MIRIGLLPLSSARFSAAPTEGTGTQVARPRLEMEFTAGPLPHPEFFHSYEDTLPGAADRILTMAEQQQRNHNARQSARLGAEIKLSSRGQLLGFGVATLALVGGMALVYLDKSVEGVVAMLVPIAAIVRVFFPWQRMRKGAGPSPDRTTEPDHPEEPPS